jgi:putative N6-adenine-specific DNA methylase
MLRGMSAFTERRNLLLACAPGVAPFLAEELRALGGVPVGQELEAGVESEGTVADAMALNLRLRTATRVLYEVGSFSARSPEGLYARVADVPWEDYLRPDGYLTITSFVQTPAVRDPRYATVKCKDAVVDRLRDRTGQRPDTGNERRGAVVFLYWNQDTCKVYLDTSGESLSKRGYRKIPLDAPLQETLAAAVILALGWNGRDAFVNPMCGSGTLAIEAALMGAGRPPGLLRSDFAFLHLVGFDAPAWQALRTRLRNPTGTQSTGPIVATDLRPEAVEAARQNARTAGVEQRIAFGVCDFAETPVPPAPGVVVLNPEYGDRMGQEKDLEAEYRRIGDFLKQRCQGYRGGVFTGNLEAGKRVGLRPRRKIRFINSRKECRLFTFELYAGSVRRGRLQTADHEPEHEEKKAEGGNLRPESEK